MNSVEITELVVEARQELEQVSRFIQDAARLQDWDKLSRAMLKIGIAVKNCKKVQVAVLQMWKGEA